jgi:hypothetical protein
MEQGQGSNGAGAGFKWSRGRVFNFKWSRGRPIHISYLYFGVNMMQNSDLLSGGIPPKRQIKF